VNNKRIIRAETMGFCMGVRRALELTEQTLDSTAKRPVYTLGPLIHNRPVLERLRRRGVREAEGPGEIQEGTVIIRAHGVTPDILEELRGRDVSVVDATCTRVIASMRHAYGCSRKGYHVILVGDAAHGEIRAIAGYSDSYTVIELNGDYPDFSFPDKSVVIGQTTLREADYNAVCGALKKRFPRIKIVDSICPATEKRQKALRDLLKKADAIVIIGGKNSANTKRLYETAKQQLSATWHVETADDLPENIGEYDTVGITAGASTPDWIIDAIEERIRSLW
jgi:4-hydroxy-3-methylbut-2-en-1-yl diphosphate reductase